MILATASKLEVEILSYQVTLNYNLKLGRVGR